MKTEHEALKTLEKLSHRVAIYVPSTVDVDKVADTSKWRKNAAQGLSRLYGGATEMPGIGHWIADDGRMVDEPVTIVYSFAKADDFDDPAKMAEVISYCKRMGKTLGQEAISLELDGELYFVRD